MATTTAGPKAPTKKASAKRASAKKASTGKAAGEKSRASAAKTSAGTKESSSKKTSSSKSAEKETPKKASAGSAGTGKTAKAAAPKKTPAKKAASKKATGTATVGERLTGRKAAKAKSLVVGQAEEPWSKSELAEVRTELEAELGRLTADLEIAEHDLFELVSSSQGSQGDEADAGSFSSERQHEMSVAENSRALLLQTTTALGRIADGTYGRCESCDEAIGKMRLQAFPRATLCMPCKQHQERR